MEPGRENAMGMLSGLLLWGDYFLLSYLISGLGCETGFGEARLAGVNALRLLLLGVGVLFGLVIFFLGLRAARAGRDATASKSGAGSSEGVQQMEFLHRVRAGLYGLSLVGVVWLALTAAIGPVC